MTDLPSWFVQGTTIEEQLEAQVNRELPEWFASSTTALDGTFKPEGYNMGTERDLLDFIGAKEANNNYNAFYGNASNTEVKFTEMTIDEVMDWQRNFVAQGSPSSAVGNFQFLRKTLNDLKRTERLSGDEIFDEQMQDRLATALLKRRGLDKFKAGNMTSKAFANNLAKEWASLPVVDGPKMGRSYYDGDGLNKALVDVKPFLEVVASIAE